MRKPWAAGVFEVDGTRIYSPESRNLFVMPP
jgi:hypothetical protein